MANIKFSPDEVEGIAGEIVNCKDNVEDAIDKFHVVEDEMNKLEGVIINDLCANWDGQASDKYSDEFTTLKKDVMNNLSDMFDNLGKFVNLLEDLDTQLRSIIVAMKEADENLANAISMK